MFMTQSVIDKHTVEFIQNMVDAAESKGNNNCFLNVSKLPPGDFLFRILSPIKSGWESWSKHPETGAPKKSTFRLEQRSEAIEADQNRKPILFFFFTIYAVKEQAIKILVIKQPSLIKELTAATQKCDDLMNYVICSIQKKEGEKFPAYRFDTCTTMSPEGMRVPFKSDLPKEVQNLLNMTHFDLDALYENKSPVRDVI
jgi:hypothetical protein